MISILTHLIAFVVGGILGIVAICLVGVSKVIQADDPHRHAAAERLGVRPDDLVDTPDGFKPIPGARPQQVGGADDWYSIFVFCPACGKDNLRIRARCINCGGDLPDTPDGSDVGQRVTCPDCGHINVANKLVCLACGAHMSLTAAEVAQ